MENIKTLTVYLGSSGHTRPVFRDSAVALGQMIAAHDYNLVYGGMDTGLMGLLARTTMDSGGHVTGIIPQKLKDSERILSGLSQTILVDDLWDRKYRMFQMADAILALPGGFGTLDEALEVLYWGNLKLHNKPLVLINVEGYWNPLIEYLYTLDDFDGRFLIVVDEIEQIEEALKNWVPVVVPTDLLHHFPHFENGIKRDTAMPIIIDKATLENTYYVSCALGLRQLDKHRRGIGLLNVNGQFDHLLTFIDSAATERFVTPHCVELFKVAETLDELQQKVQSMNVVTIDLHNEKWGD